MKGILKNMNIDDFHSYIGKTIMHCQTVENDIKWIYSGMREGNYVETYNSISLWTLGKTIKQLRLLDESDGNPYLSNEDYQLLEEIKSFRNHLTHQIYRNFLYKENFSLTEEYKNECSRLKSFYERIKKLYREVEKVRLEVLKHYKRI
ncbi:MAG: hypothetical protein KKH92_06130 [Firmicutes bacterium]|nr:hypothetical protein [Bacillota bacterium]